MNITQRTCANCAAFNPAPEADEPSCMNLVNITIHHVDEDGKPLVIYQQPVADDRCDSHQTHAEDQARAEAIKAAGYPSALTNLPALDAAS